MPLLQWSTGWVYRGSNTAIYRTVFSKRLHHCTWHSCGLAVTPSCWRPENRNVCILGVLVVATNATLKGIKLEFVFWVNIFLTQINHTSGILRANTDHQWKQPVFPWSSSHPCDVSFSPPSDALIQLTLSKPPDLIQNKQMTLRTPVASINRNFIEEQQAEWEAL